MTFNSKKPKTLPAASFSQLVTKHATHVKTA